MVVFDPQRINILLTGLDTGFIMLQVYPNNDEQSSLGRGFGDKFFDKLIIAKHLPAHGLVDMAKKAVLNGVPFGGIGRVVRDDDVHTDFLCQSLQFFFLGVYAQNGAFQGHDKNHVENDMELGIPAGICPGGKAFPDLAVFIAQQEKFPFDGASADHNPMLLKKKFGDLLGPQVYPVQARHGGAASLVPVYQASKLFRYAWLEGKFFCAHRRPYAVSHPGERV